ncbi:MAG: nuclease A inhibitor family protein [Acidobacteriota bacterium]
MKRLLTVSLFLLFTLPTSAKPLCTDAALNRLTRGLTFATMLEKHVRPFMLRGKAAERFMRRVRALDDRECQPSITFEQKAAYMIDASTDPDNRPQARRLKSLLDYMRANLANLQVAYFGEEPEWDVCIFGRDRCGNIVGVRVVEVT